MPNPDYPPNVIPFPGRSSEEALALPAQPESPEAPLPPPDLTIRDLPMHQAVARLYGLDPRYSLEAQGLVTTRFSD